MPCKSFAWLSRQTCADPSTGQAIEQNGSMEHATSSASMYDDRSRFASNAECKHTLGKHLGVGSTHAEKASKGKDLASLRIWAMTELKQSARGDV